MFFPLLVNFPKALPLGESIRYEKYAICDQLVQIKRVVLYSVSHESDIQVLVCFPIAIFGIRSKSLNLQNFKQPNSYWNQ